MCPKWVEIRQRGYYTTTQHIAISFEAAEFLAMHKAWLEPRGLLHTIDYESPFTSRNRVAALVSREFRDYIDRIVIREKTDFSTATYIAVTNLMFSPEGTDINDL